MKIHNILVVSILALLSTAVLQIKIFNEVYVGETLSTFSLTAILCLLGFAIKQNAIGQSIDIFFKHVIGVYTIKSIVLLGALILAVKSSMLNSTAILYTALITYFLFMFYEVYMLQCGNHSDYHE